MSLMDMSVKVPQLKKSWQGGLGEGVGSSARAQTQQKKSLSERSDEEDCFVDPSTWFSLTAALKGAG